MEKLKSDLYVIVDLVFNENTKKEDKKQFYAVVLGIIPSEEKAKVFVFVF